MLRIYQCSAFLPASVLLAIVKGKMLLAFLSLGTLRWAVFIIDQNSVGVRKIIFRTPIDRWTEESLK